MATMVSIFTALPLMAIIVATLPQGRAKWTTERSFWIDTAKEQRNRYRFCDILFGIRVALHSHDKEGKAMSRLGHSAKVLVLLLCLFSGFLYFTTGFFVIQPIGAVPEGATVWYWRLDTSLPFISSADGLLLNKQLGVSLLGRAVALGAVAKPITDRKIVTLPYTRTLYLISTEGREFERWGHWLTVNRTWNGNHYHLDIALAYRRCHCQE
jgi:hypothetical protein